MRKRKGMLLALMLLLVVSACTDQDLVTVSKALNDTAQGVSVLQTSVINANKTALLSDDATRTFLELSIKINQAGLTAVDLTREINKLAPADRSRLLVILNPIIDVVREARTQGLLGIKNEQTKANIDAALFTIATALNIAQLTLASR